MPQLTTAPYGLWPSPLHTDALATAVRLDAVRWHDNLLLWLEYRGDQGVVVALDVSASGGALMDLTERHHNVRARVGYGGGSFDIAPSTLLFVERDGRIYRQPVDPGSATPITPSFGCAASPAIAPNGRHLVYVHHDGVNDCLAITRSSGAGWPRQLVTGADFYMDPVWHPGGHTLAWIEWDHPAMPWDGTRLMLGQLDLSADPPALDQRRCIAGGPHNSITQPRFSPDGRHLAFLSDENGWMNLYLYDLGSEVRQCVVAAEAELGPPAWVQGSSTYGFARNGRSIFVLSNRHGFHELVQAVDGQAAEPVRGLEAYTELRSLAVSPRAGVVALVGSSSHTPTRVLLWNDGVTRVLRQSASERVPERAYAAAEPVSWRASDGQSVYGLLYRPTSLTHEGSGRPPAIVSVHGGPTSQAIAGYNPRAQFFATRGYVYIEVNYRGSSGYGRPYQCALDGKWGIYDVEDIVSAREFLCRQGLAHERRVAVMGGSAGGYTVLKTLTDHPGVFAAGVSLYGVSNLFTLASDTHKFEAHYLDTLIGPLPAAAELYRTRSPLFAADRIRDPIAIFQGSHDRVVPPDQAEQIVASLRRRGIPHEYHLYEGEEHGFRRPATVRRFYDDLERFLRQYVVYA